MSTRRVLPNKWKYIYEERAAIMEFDGKLPRAEAEKRAWREVERAMYDEVKR